MSDENRVFHTHENCACHINPPCHYCTDCEICGVDDSTDLGVFIDSSRSQLSQARAEVARLKQGPHDPDDTVRIAALRTLGERNRLCDELDNANARADSNLTSALAYQATNDRLISVLARAIKFATDGLSRAIDLRNEATRAGYENGANMYNGARSAFEQMLVILKEAGE